MFITAPLLLLSMKLFPLIISDSVSQSVTLNVTAFKTKFENIEGSGSMQQVFLYNETIEGTLRDHYLAKIEYILENLVLVDRAEIPDLYSIFTFEILHNLFLGFFGAA